MALEEDEKVVVTCPKCKTRLKVEEKKLLPQGSRFKCPKCSTGLIVKKPAAPPKKALDNKKILVAHSNPAIVEKVASMLTTDGYTVISSSDGIDAVVKALREFPFLCIIEVVLPKIYGFEVCKRLKARQETKGMKFLLITSPYDKTKYRREPASLYGADEYIEDHAIVTELMSKIGSLSGKEVREEEDEPRATQQTRKPLEPDITKQSFEPSPQSIHSLTPETEKRDEKTERASRLARTIINDIYLYNSARVDEALRNDNFYTAFAAEINEGKKLYESRIALDVRSKGNFFTDAIDNFLAAKKKTLG